MISDLVVFDEKLTQLSDIANFYLCLFGYAVAFVHAFMYATSKLGQVRIEHVHQLPAELADLRRGTDEVNTQLYDEVARVRASNTDVFRKLKAEVNDLHADDNKFVVELRDQFTQLSQQNQAAKELVTAAIVRTRTLEAEVEELSKWKRANDKTVRELREHVTRLGHQNDAASAKMRTLEAELNAQRQKHVEISDFARRAYIQLTPLPI
jgi:phage host-nuclease inhibitor protein Gam